MQLIDFCAKSMNSCNPKVVYHAAIYIFNHLLCWEKEKMTELTPLLQNAVVAICAAMTEEEKSPALGKAEDSETLNALLLCLCRILYKNFQVCTWVEKEINQ